MFLKHIIFLLALSLLVNARSVKKDVLALNQKSQKNENTEFDRMRKFEEKRQRMYEEFLQAMIKGLMSKDLLSRF